LTGILYAFFFLELLDATILTLIGDAERLGVEGLLAGDLLLKRGQILKLLFF